MRIPLAMRIGTVSTLLSSLRDPKSRYMVRYFTNLPRSTLRLNRSSLGISTFFLRFANRAPLVLSTFALLRVLVKLRQVETTPLLFLHELEPRLELLYAAGKLRAQRLFLIDRLRSGDRRVAKLTL